MSSTDDATDGSDDSWQEIATHRDLLEEIVEENGPFAPEARELLNALEERGEA